LQFVIPTTGSRGDVQPYVALGKGLREAGHEVRVATHADFASLVLDHGLDFFPVAASARTLQQTEAGDHMVSAGRNPFRFMRQYARLREPWLHDLMAGCSQACQDADLVIVPTTGFLPGHAAAEKLGLPTLSVHCVPMTPTRYLASTLFPQLPTWLPGRRVYNYLSHLVVGEYFWQRLRKVVNQARQEILDLPPIRFLGPSIRLFRDVPILYGYSATVIPKPPDWGPNHHVTGYWFLDGADTWEPPAELVDFLDAGPPPVAVGFGSMHHRDAEALTDVVIQALERAGQRGILLTGWGGLSDARPAEHIYALEAAPHDWLLPRTAAVVHHGGAGTTAAGLRAGVPSLVVPFMADQMFWGQRVASLGAGPRPILPRRLSVSRLAHATRRMMEDTALRERAAALGQRLRREDGVGRAVEIIQRHVRQLPARLRAGPAALPICRP
jgi:UDP:flavonoid glycosyltransferase YjiC (YdhE family)